MASPLHVREQIRKAVADRLSRRVSEVRVFLGRRYPVTPGELATYRGAILIYSQSPSLENSAIGSMGGPRNRRLERLMSLTIDVLAADTDAVDGRLDTIGADIETAIDEDVFLTTDSVRLTKNMWLARSDLIFNTLPGGQTETSIGVLRMLYSVVYHTMTGTPRVAA